MMATDPPHGRNAAEALLRLIADPDARARFNAASPAQVDAAIAQAPPGDQPAARAFEAAAERPVVAVPWCPRSPRAEHSWRMRDGERVCDHCGGVSPRVRP